VTVVLVCVHDTGQHILFECGRIPIEEIGRFLELNSNVPIDKFFHHN
jgi:hypothetical protein